MNYDYSEETIFTSKEDTTLMFKSLSRIDCYRGNTIGSIAWSVPKLYSDYEFLDGFLYGTVNDGGHFIGEFTTYGPSTSNVE